MDQACQATFSSRFHSRVIVPLTALAERSAAARFFKFVVEKGLVSAPTVGHENDGSFASFASPVDDDRDHGTKAVSEPPANAIDNTAAASRHGLVLVDGLRVVHTQTYNAKREATGVNARIH